MMIAYHVARALIFSYLAFIPITIGCFFYWLSQFFIILGNLLNKNWDLRSLNPLRTYRNIKENINSDQFHKWSGKRKR